MKNLPGKLTISRISSNFEPHDLMKIDLHDETSGVLVTSVVISMSDFALAITGLARVPCKFDFHPEQVGKVLGQKTATIAFTIHYDINYASVVKRARSFEVDGWCCSLTPGQRIEATKIGAVYHVTVPFQRYVKVSQEEEEA